MARLPCAVDPAGVTLYRWPMRPVFIPLERVDRFDVVLGQAEEPGIESEHLVLFTRDGTMLYVRQTVTQRLIAWRRLPRRSTAQRLNNLVAEHRRG